ncbi:sensor histidine kinase [Agromyces marinus]|uniref:sensor histidine kinase n=1 Tax=Agromyces marinus TaxID=1389020 RepID=UPI001F3DB66C|nr:HAMP domain-containing sensor histidine kinase [Agromyces marinus]UIP57646.1 putative sensor histidine kinase TcrY [Agromyces marinus]
MTHPGDPGHAAAARRDALAHSASPAGEPMADAAPDVGRRPWSLHRRLLAILTVLLVAVSVVIGVVTVLVFHSTSVERLDASLRAAAARAADVAPSGVPTDPRSTVLEFLSVPGQPVGTLGVLIAGDTTVGGYISELGELLEADRSALRALSSVPADSRPHTVDAGALGPYRAIAVDTDSQLRGVLALPLADVNAQTAQLALTVAIVAAGGLLLALGIGSIVVRRALSPLSEVTATARRVSELPLDRGDVALGERVPAVDDGTEVGRLGTSFNRMLEHVASALSARERSEQKVRRFVADASHELRTPLASIRGYAELTRLHGGQLPADVVHAFERIESESKRMTELVEDLLLLARLDEGREVRRDPVDLGRLVADAVGDAQVASPDHSWRVDAPASEVVVDGDASRLHQAVANLLANARVHTPEGTEVVVGLSVPTAADGGAERARITVADDGPGIDEGVRASLFERFVRGDASRSRRAGSTGLGLAIVKGVVEAHGGTVAVESAPGRTVFTLDLPLARGH